MPAARIGAPRSWLLLGACCGALALVAAPALLSPFGPAAWACGDYGACGEVARLLLQPICHQLAERSFALFGSAFAVCHRCTGLYVGFTLGVALWPCLPALAERLAQRPAWILAGAIPLAADALIGYLPAFSGNFANFGNTPSSRFATGALAAFPVALLPLLALSERRAGAGAESDLPRSWG